MALFKGSTNRISYKTSVVVSGASEIVKPDAIELSVFREDGTEVAGEFVVEWDAVKELNFVEFPVTSTDTLEDGERLTFVWAWTYASEKARQEVAIAVSDSIRKAAVPFNTLSDKAKAVIYEVKERFGNLYDSELGGPHLPDESAKFDDDTYALLLKHSIGAINSLGSVSKNFRLTDYPFAAACGEQTAVAALMVEVIKHFIVSYTEQASADGMNGPYLSRRDYMDRWKGNLDEAKESLKNSVSALDRDITGGIVVASLIYSNQMPWGVSDRVRPMRRWYR